MDRRDEKRRDRSAEAVRDAELRRKDDRRRDDERPGDVLGLSGSEVPKSPDDPRTEYDPASIAKRRQRAAEAGEPGVAAPDETERGAGATGIDMGAGGTGTDIKRD